MLLELLKTMSPSGFEDEARNFILDKVKDLEHEIDSMGNIIVHKPGTGKRVMISAHMDEVGFIISKITDSGALRFKSVGGIETTVMAGKSVIIGKNRVHGVIGSKPVHLQSANERNAMGAITDLIIDIGAKDKTGAEALVKVGDYATFATESVKFGDNLLMAKGLDDKVGCSILLELLKEENDLDLYAAFTVQEEVGLRGSMIAAKRINPEAAIVFEGTTCSDVFPTPEEKTVTKLHGGAVLTAMDRTAISDRSLFEAVKKCAEENSIPYQIKRTIAGGTDAGSIQKCGSGVRTLVIATPCRYIHSPVSVMCFDDYNACLNLGKKVLKLLEDFKWNS